MRLGMCWDENRDKRGDLGAKIHSHALVEGHAAAGDCPYHDRFQGGTAGGVYDSLNPV